MSEALLRVSNMSRKTRSNRQTELSFDLAAAPGADELSPHRRRRQNFAVSRESSAVLHLLLPSRRKKGEKYEIQDRDTNRNFFFDLAELVQLSTAS